MAATPVLSEAFDGQNRLGADACAVEAREGQNRGIEAYVMSYLMPAPMCDPAHAVTDASLQSRARQPWLGYGLDTCRIDDDSDLRLAKRGLTTVRGRQQLSVRTFEAAPDLSHGQQHGVAQDDGPGLTGALRVGMDTSMLKACSRITEKDFQRFTPNVCAVPVQSIVPTFWVHGGAPSRDIARSDAFLKTVGLPVAPQRPACQVVPEPATALP